MTSHNFHFGLETEYVVFDKATKRALWQPELTFTEVNALLESISLHDIPGLDGLELEPPHQKLMPYVVEGYHLPDADFRSQDMLPKGIEIRTPVCSSIEQCLDVQKILLTRLATTLAVKDWAPMALSHHPNAHKFQGRQNKRRHDFWQWAMEAMTTYGPDINVGVPQDVWDGIDFEDLNGKINFYAPAMSALSLHSPFRNGELWKIQEKQGRSLRVYRRSIVAPPIEIHPDENRRLEFKVFEMTPSLDEVEGYFKLFMTLMLDNTLPGRASNATRIYDSGAVAIEGLSAPRIEAKLAALFERAEKALPQWGFTTRGLTPLHQRLETQQTPADDLIASYREKSGYLPDTLAELADRTINCL